MATSTISNTITDPSGNAVAGVVVNARLKPNGVGYRVSDNTEVATLVSTTSNASGFWQLNLERNSNITPSGSYYEIEERIPDGSGGARSWAITVGVSNQTVYAALVVSPPSIAPPVAYLTQTTADARYQALGSFGGVTVVNTATYAGIATSASRSDHQHSLSNGLIVPAHLVSGWLLAAVATSTVTATVATGQWTYNSVSAIATVFDGSIQQPAGQAGRAWTYVDQVVRATNGAITFSNIPQTFTHLQLVCQLRATSANNGTILAIRFNGDTAGNYAEEYLVGVNSNTPSNISTNSTTVAAIAFTYANSDPTSYASAVTIDIPNYRGSFYKAAGGQGGMHNPGVLAEFIVGHVSWRNTAAITQIDLWDKSGSANSWITGSTATLLGIR